MPGITFKVANHPAEAVRPSPLRSSKHYLAENPFADLYQNERCGKVLKETPWKHGDFRSHSNGFVLAVIDAYNMHHNLMIRPDDVWLAIIIQFGIHVNGNAEAMRSMFVEHQGKKELKVTGLGSLETADYGWFAQQMTKELKKNLKDHSISDWILPSFSTTTNNDTVVGSVAMMATMKEYFSYKFCMRCGIPQVTLAGTVEDWQEIHDRVDKLHNYGEICSKWAALLKKITTQLLQTSQGVIDSQFWSQICHYRSFGSGSAYICGWVSTFCVFDSQGKWQANNFKVPGEGSTLQFPVIDDSDVPPGYLTVDVTVDDNGTEFNTLMFAGHMGYDVVDKGKGIAPKLTWAIVLKDVK